MESLRWHPMLKVGEKNKTSSLSGDTTRKAETEINSLWYHKSCFSSCFPVTSNERSFFPAKMDFSSWGIKANSVSFESDGKIWERSFNSDLTLDIPPGFNLCNNFGLVLWAVAKTSNQKDFFEIIKFRRLHIHERFMRWAFAWGGTRGRAEVRTAFSSSCF